MSFKIQIASLAALERLIGGEEEIELELRQSVAENFAKKHLKGLVSDEFLQATARSLLKEVQDTVFDKKEFGSGYYKKIEHVLKEQLVGPIREEIKLQLRDVIRELISENLNVPELRQTLADTIEKQAKYIVEELTESNLNGRLDAMVDKKIKERLGVK